MQGRTSLSQAKAAWLMILTETSPTNLISNNQICELYAQLF